MVLAILVQDNFNRAATTTGLGTSTSGQVWTAQGGTYGIDDLGQAYTVTNLDNDHTTIDCGVANYIVSCDVKGSYTVAPVDTANVLFRYNDMGNHLICYTEQGDIYLIKREAGSWLLVTSTPYTPPQDTYFNMKVTCNGNNIIIAVDNVEMINWTLTGTDATNFGTSSRAGLFFGAGRTPTLARWDNFLITDLAGAGGATHVGASLSGSGSLTGDRTAIVHVGANPSGAGSLTGARTAIVHVGSNPSGAGSLTANFKITNFINPAASLSGAGTLTGDRTAVVHVGSSPSGAGSLAADFKITNFVNPAAALAGAASFTADAKMTITAGAAFAGSGSITADAAPISAIAGSAALSGSGSIAAEPRQEIRPAGSLSGTGGLTAAFKITNFINPSAALSGIGSLTGARTAIVHVGSSPSGTGSLTAAFKITNYINPAAALAGAGSATAEPMQVIRVATDQSGAGSITANASVSALPTGLGATFSGAGSLEATPRLTLRRAADLSGAGSLTGEATAAFYATAILSSPIEIIPDSDTLANHFWQTPGNQAYITDLGSVNNGSGTIRNYFQRTSIVGGSDHRIVSDRNLNPYTIDKTKDYTMAVEILINAIATSIQHVLAGTAVNDVVNSEKTMFNLNADGTLTMLNGCAVLSNIVLPDGYRRVIVKIPASFWTGTGNTCRFTQFTGWQNLGTYDFYYRNPHLNDRANILMTTAAPTIQFRVGASAAGSGSAAVTSPRVTDITSTGASLSGSGSASAGAALMIYPEGALRGAGSAAAGFRFVLEGVPEITEITAIIADPPILITAMVALEIDQIRGSIDRTPITMTGVIKP